MPLNFRDNVSASELLSGEFSVLLRQAVRVNIANYKIVSSLLLNVSQHFINTNDERTLDL